MTDAEILDLAVEHDIGVRVMPDDYCDLIGVPRGTRYIAENVRPEFVVQFARLMLEKGATGAQGLRPCRSPYCECEQGKCTHPGCYDARGVPVGAPGDTDAERAAWLADKIVAHGDYAKEAAAMLRRWPADGTPACLCGQPISDECKTNGCRWDKEKNRG